MESKIIIAGSRGFNDYDLLSKVIFEQSEKFEAMSIVSGMAKGADALAVKFAKEHGVQLYEFPADWSQGKAAGYMRNKEMADFSQGLIAFWDGESPGTRHMINLMRNRNKFVYVVLY
jgi:hypothetical protein